MPTISIDQAKKTKKNLQTILVPDYYSLSDSKKWLRDHNYVNSNYRKMINYIRFLQNFPIKGAKYYTKKLPNNLDLVFQEY